MSTLQTASELAPSLKISERTLRRWAQQNIVPAIRVTRRTLRFDPQAVEAALRQSHPAPARA